MNARRALPHALLFCLLLFLALLFLAPVLIVLMNSFKGRFYIADAPFRFPDASTFSGLQNYQNGIAKTGFPAAFGYSLFITVFSVLAVVFFCSMTAWYITRVRSPLRRRSTTCLCFR